MKLKFEKGNLLNATQIASRGIPAHTMQPILECILVEAVDGNIALRSTDMEMAIKTNVDGEIIESGIIALDAKMFADIVRKMPDGEITITSDENYQTEIKSGKAKFRIAGRDGNAFPKTAEVEDAQEIIVSEFSLKELIRTTIFSIAADSSQKSMTGELIRVKGDRFSATSLDGHRISIRNIDLRNSYEEVSAIVPGRTLTEVMKSLSGDADLDAKIVFNKNNIEFSFGNTTLVSRTIDSEFFDIKSIVNMQPSTTITVNKQEFADCIDRATLFTKSGEKKPVILETKDNAIEVRIESAIGGMHETVSCSRTGNDLKIGCNPAFLVDILKNIDIDEVTLYLTSEKMPIIIRDRETFLYLALPISMK